MNPTLEGKKVALLVALPHHGRFLVPLAEGVRRAGGEALFFVPLGEYPYELDLVRRGERYVYLTDYLDAARRDRQQEVLLDLADAWHNRFVSWDGARHWSFFEQARSLEGLVEEYLGFEGFLETEKPDALVALHERNRWGKLIGYLADQRGIPYLTLQEGDYHEKRLSFSVHTEYSTVDLLWGESTRRMLVRHHAAADKMVLVGNTHLESAVAEYRRPAVRKRVRRELGLPTKKKTALVLPSLEWSIVIDPKIWRTFFENFPKDVAVVVKWHPNATRDTFEKARSAITGVWPAAVVVQRHNAYALAGAADCCITLGKTTLALECLFFGLPLFSLPNWGCHEDEYVERGVSQSVSPVGNWTVLDATLEGGLPDGIRSRVEDYMAESLHRFDGKAVERAVEVFAEIFKSRDGVQLPSRSRPARPEGTTVPGRVSLIVPTGSDLDAFFATVRSLADRVNLPDWEAVVVLSDEALKPVVGGLEGDIRIVEKGSDRLGELWNAGAAASTGEILVFLEPGIVLCELADLAERARQGTVGSSVRYHDMSVRSFGVGFDFNGAPEFIQCSEDLSRRVGPDGGLIAVSERHFSSIGGFDSGVANHMVAADFALAAREAGIPSFHNDKAIAVFAAAGLSTPGDAETCWRGRVRFFSKWCGKLPRDGEYLSRVANLFEV